MRGEGARDILLTANGPGEVAGWLAPVARRLLALRDRLAPRVRLFVWVPPCNFATGHEVDTVRAMGAFDGIFTPREMWRFLLARRLPAGYQPARRGLVLFLGGDLFYAAAAARRLGYPAAAYTEGRARWLRIYERFFVPGPAAARQVVAAGLGPDRVEVVGDLVVDAVLDRLARATGGSRPAASGLPGLSRPGSGRSHRIPDEVPVVGLFAGSRDFEVRWVLPMMMEAAVMISREMSSRVRFVVVRSPFARREWVEQALQDGVGAHALRDGMEVELDPERREAAMARCSVAVSVPGTVTAELGVLGVPTITVLPLQRPDLLPLEGLPGVLGSLPGVGPAVKRRVVAAGVRRLGPVSLPARRAGRRIGPELVGSVTARDIAREVVALLRDEPARQRIGEEARQAMGPAGAADRIAVRVLERLGHPLQDGEVGP